MESWKSELYHAVSIGSIPEEDRKYGIPEQKKFPMPDKQHVISAIKFFNYVTPKYEKQLAKAILARMKEYGMSFEDIGVGEDNRFSKYIPKKDQELAHHGILGMKWGVRRFQNKDGSFTEAGQKRYGSSKLTDEDAARLEKNISKVWEKKDYSNLRWKDEYKKREQDREEKAAANKEITKMSFDLVKKSKEISSILDEARGLEETLDKEAEKWQNDKNLVRKTAEDYIKDRNITDAESKQYYLNMGGIDAASDLWGYYHSNNKRLNDLYDKKWNLRSEFLIKSKDAVKDMLGSYGNKKLTQVSWQSGSPTVSEYISNQLDSRIDEYLWLGDSMFDTNKR